MRALIYRACITVINIIFPPLAVAMLCGFEWDCMLNCVLFLCAVVPSHVHGFYISCTYFHRRHKVKKGRYPGGPKSMIHSSNVVNGGASNVEVARLWRKEKGLGRESSGPSRSRQGSMRHNDSQRPEMAQPQSGNTSRPAAYTSDSYRPGVGQQSSYQHASHGPEPVHRQTSQLERTGTNRSRLSNQGSRPGAIRTGPEEHMAQEGYGAPQCMPSSRMAAQANSYSPISPQASQSSRFRGH